MEKIAMKRQNCSKLVNFYVSVYFRPCKNVNLKIPKISFFGVTGSVFNLNLNLI